MTVITWRAIRRPIRRANWPPIESLRNIFLKPRAISIRRWSGWRCRLPERAGEGKFPSASCENPKERRSRRLWCSGAASMRSKKSAPSDPYLKRWPGDARDRYAGRGGRAPGRVGERRTVMGRSLRLSSRVVRISIWIALALHGGSTGGYWATKVAHTHAARLRAAVNQGGPAHFAFQKDWIVNAQRGEYPFELAETLACAFGRSTAKNGSNTRRSFRSSIKEFSTTLRAAALCQRRQR